MYYYKKLNSSVIVIVIKTVIIWFILLQNIRCTTIIIVDLAVRTMGSFGKTWFRRRSKVFARCPACRVKIRLKGSPRVAFCCNVCGGGCSVVQYKKMSPPLRFRRAFNQARRSDEKDGITTVSRCTLNPRNNLSRNHSPRRLWPGNL